MHAAPPNESTSRLGGCYSCLPGRRRRGSHFRLVAANGCVLLCSQTLYPKVDLRIHVTFPGLNLTLTCGHCSPVFTTLFICKNSQIFLTPCNTTCCAPRTLIAHNLCRYWASLLQFSDAGADSKCSARWIDKTDCQQTCTKLPFSLPVWWMCSSLLCVHVQTVRGFNRKHCHLLAPGGIPCKAL